MDNGTARRVDTKTGMLNPHLARIPQFGQFRNSAIPQFASSAIKN
jgi:hypothetical protein